MLLYSKNIIKFINTIKSIVKDVLSREIRLKVFGDRFYDRAETNSYPIKVVIFNNQTKLGYFDPHFYEIGFHECLMHSNKELLQNIIRHELAHYVIFINHGETVKAHGDEFREFCVRMKWSEDVYKATLCLDDVAFIPEEENQVLRKVQKLMALATSSNKHEAEQAMIKSQQLLLKHNIDFNNIQQDEEKIFLKRIMKQAKKNAKMRSIALILETFFVNTVYNRIEGFTYLEVVGNSTNIEIADYVASTLQHKLETLWNQAKKQQSSLKGTIAKSSFFLGVAKGYCDKINFLKMQYDSSTSNALMIIEKKLKDANAMVYPHLTKSYSHANYCSKSSWLGEQVGKELSINPAVDNESKKSEAYLSFKSL